MLRCSLSGYETERINSPPPFSITISHQHFMQNYSVRLANYNYMELSVQWKTVSSIHRVRFTTIQKDTVPTHTHNTFTQNTIHTTAHFGSLHFICMQTQSGYFTLSKRGNKPVQRHILTSLTNFGWIYYEGDFKIWPPKMNEQTHNHSSYIQLADCHSTRDFSWTVFGQLENIFVVDNFFQLMLWRCVLYFSNIYNLYVDHCSLHREKWYFGKMWSQFWLVQNGFRKKKQKQKTTTKTTIQV